ncbi:MAG: hypothetical protein ACI8P9_003752 [Parasphingorhabdus sp.]|jgi:hypothetical protein
MNTETTNHFYTRNILIQIGILSAICVAIIFWQSDFLHQIYIKDQVSDLGMSINGGILLLFLSGLFRLVMLFMRYHKEEQMLNRFILNIRQKVEPTQGVDTQSLIIQRYRTLLDLHNRRTAINHNALASTLIASESSLIGFPKFVHNIMILTGVFGTIVSLSIALLGASDMISNINEISGLGDIIYGMSTALSTTMTAIVCYLFFGYFYLRLTDTQTYLISRIEDITATVLLPRFQVQQETVVKDFSDVIRAAAALVKKLDSSQAQYEEAASKLNSILDVYRDEMHRNGESLDEIVGLLKRGFRLSETEE